MKIMRSRYGLLTAVLAVMFLFLCLMLGREWRDWRDSATWVAVPSDSLAIQPKSSRVRYAYTVNGRSYSSERTHFFVTAAFQDRRVLSWINENRGETAVTVYYDPDAPQRAVLVRAVDRGWLAQGPLICGVAAVAVLLPLLFFGSLWRWLRRQFS